MNVFDFRKQLIHDYAAYISSFIKIQDPRIDKKVADELKEGLLWPEALIQLNPYFEFGETVDELIGRNILHKECARTSRSKKDDSVGKYY